MSHDDLKDIEDSLAEFFIKRMTYHAIVISRLQDRAMGLLLDDDVNFDITEFERLDRLIESNTRMYTHWSVKLGVN